MNAPRIFLAEFVATFALCFVGVLAIAVAGDSLVTVALAHGFTILVMVAAMGAVSGAHINPAVTFGFVVTGRMNPVTGAIYVAAQLAGAVAAGGLLLVVLGGTDVVASAGKSAAEVIAAGTPQLTGVSVATGIILEIVATYILVFVIFGSAVDDRAPKSVFPIAIGLAVVVGILAIGPLTGAAMNPARHFGPALVSGQWDNVLVYWIGPLVGATLGAMTQHFFLMHQSPSAAVAEHGGPAPSEERVGR